MELNEKELDQLWKKCLENDKDAIEMIKSYYMNQLIRIKPLYQHIEDNQFSQSLENAVCKAIERGIKFQIQDNQTYMLVASETYFKSFFNPDSDSIHIPFNLLQAFSRLEEIYQQLPELKQKNDQEQIRLLSLGFEYPSFETRLLYYSYLKWKQDLLRQVDIDLTVTLLPGPQRVEWEIFYEKQVDEVQFSIEKELNKGEAS